jgi:hypothetical protein
VVATILWVVAAILMVAGMLADHPSDYSPEHLGESLRWLPVGPFRCRRNDTDRHRFILRVRCTAFAGLPSRRDDAR